MIELHCVLRGCANRLILRVRTPRCCCGGHAGGKETFVRMSELSPYLRYPITVQCDKERKMTTMFELLILAAFSVSIIYFENADSQISECRIPVNSSIAASLNVYVNLSEEEFDLLQIEGQCFLFCVTLTRDKYSTEVSSMYVNGIDICMAIIAIMVENSLCYR